MKSIIFFRFFKVKKSLFKLFLLNKINNNIFLSLMFNPLKIWWFQTNNHTQEINKHTSFTIQRIIEVNIGWKVKKDTWKAWWNYIEEIKFTSTFWRKIWLHRRMWNKSTCQRLSKWLQSTDHSLPLSLLKESLFSQEKAVREKVCFLF